VRVAVVGTGHVGAVTCVSLATLGHEVVGTDQDQEKIDRLSQGVVPFFEPDLQELLQRELASGRLRFSYELADAVTGAEVVFICVGTPPREGGEANLIAVEHSARAVARHATEGAVVVEKATVPTGTAKRLGTLLRRERPDVGLEVASNPEFLREGTAVIDAMEPPRILVGAESDTAFAAMRELYQPQIAKGIPYIETDIQTAELAKYASNAFLALKISFANALARLCERAEADVAFVADIIGSDPRIGREFLNAGLGYGGSCFPKDLMAFERLASRLGYDFGLLREIARINDEAVQATAEKVKDVLWNLEGKRVVLLGLAFKPGTDDVRFAPALNLARLLLAEGAVVVGHDPEALHNAKSELPELEVSSDPYAAAEGASCVVVCTEWDDFRELDLPRLREIMADPVVVDARNLFEPEQMRAAGFTYYPTGRPPVIQEP
jgi:UDPglucose 6-dehydrogenase